MSSEDESMTSQNVKTGNCDKKNRSFPGEVLTYKAFTSAKMPDFLETIKNSSKTTKVIGLTVEKSSNESNTTQSQEGQTALFPRRSLEEATVLMGETMKQWSIRC